MTRCVVYDYSDYEAEIGEPKVDGWYDEDKATVYPEATRWEEGNRISVATGSQWNHESVVRTAGGRWTLFSYSQWQGTPNREWFITDKDAYDWLMVNGHDDAVAEHFGEPEPERGPGRPEIGPAILVRIPEAMLATINERASEAGASRAETIRQLLAASLTNSELEASRP